MDIWCLICSDERNRELLIWIFLLDIFTIDAIKAKSEANDSDSCRNATRFVNASLHGFWRIGVQIAPNLVFKATINCEFHIFTAIIPIILEWRPNRSPQGHGKNREFLAGCKPRRNSMKPAFERQVRVLLCRWSFNTARQLILCLYVCKYDACEADRLAFLSLVWTCIKYWSHFPQLTQSCRIYARNDRMKHFHNRIRQDNNWTPRDCMKITSRCISNCQISLDWRVKVVRMSRVPAKWFTNEKCVF